MQNGKDAVCTCIDSLCGGSLGFHRGQDSSVYALYTRKLLIRGWAGCESPEETVEVPLGSPEILTQANKSFIERFPQGQ